ncbi:MAG TPA: twin-arginine translocase subunit TatC [Lamprocystis sp. (in: g-proteobacteria)]|nr:twin-arginine translocase subunit TatC [Lamprocystis sp. (in: g-proteobacteria)]
MTAPLEPDAPGAELPFVSHLVELRDRLIRMLIAVAVIMLLTAPFANGIYTYVAAPLMAKLPEGSTMIATQVISPFLTPFKLALVAAVFIAMPYLLYQIWGFVAPGLYRHEKRLALPLLVSSIALFYIGMLFAYYLVFPIVFAFMAATTPAGVSMMTDISAYLDFVLTLFFAFGIAFEVPIATILLVAIGVTTPEGLVEKRPYVIVGAFVIGMFLTPPDIFSQTLLAVPMWLLFELGVFASRIMMRDRAAREAAEAEQELAAGAGAGSVGSGGRTDPRPTGPGAQVGAAASEVGRELEPGDLSDPNRWRPLTDEEMEAELDLEDAQTIPAPVATAPTDPVDAKIEQANRLRELDNPFAARQILYQVLEEGDESQRGVARNILNQLDEV